MRFSSFRTASSLAAFLLVAGLAATMAQPAQSQRMPSTLRYGSGLIDIPAASVLPHLAFTGTYSGFMASIPEFVIVDPHGHLITPGSQYEKWLSDGSIALGLFNRVEIGASLQHFADEEEGGTMLGGFARISVLPASIRNFDLALGARYVTSPTFGDRYSYEFQPNRLGYPDSRLHSTVGHDDDDEFSGNLTPYAVATAHLPISAASSISLTGGWGTGLFSAGDDLHDFHADGSAQGAFGGVGAHIGIGGNRQISLMAEYNGIDVNSGVQVDLGYVRVGAFGLGLLHDAGSTFLSRKFGVLASVAIPTIKPDTMITPYTVTRADTTITPRMVVTVDTTMVGRPLPAAVREVIAQRLLYVFDESAINEENEAMLREKIDALRAHPSVMLSIEGHADDIGDEQYNYDLGMARAANVFDFLTGNGIAASRLSAISHGETVPFVETNSFREMGPNRRVEFVITAEEMQEMMITADTMTMADTTITEHTIEMADTVITPSRWGHNTMRGNSDDAPDAVATGLPGKEARADVGALGQGDALWRVAVDGAPRAGQDHRFAAARRGEPLGGPAAGSGSVRRERGRTGVT